MRVIWALAAQDDVFDIAEYYDELDPGVADEMVRRFEAATLQLGDFAHSGAAVDSRGKVRKRTVAGTPYILLYEVGDGRIEVQRVVHVASDWRP